MPANERIDSRRASRRRRGARKQRRHGGSCPRRPFRALAAYRWRSGIAAVVIPTTAARRDARTISWPPRSSGLAPAMPFGGCPGRLNQGLHAELPGEHVVLEAQRELRRLRAGRRAKTLLIAASMRDWRHVPARCGVRRVHGATRRPRELPGSDGGSCGAGGQPARGVVRRAPGCRTVCATGGGSGAAPAALAGRARDSWSSSTGTPRAPGTVISGTVRGWRDGSRRRASRISSKSRMVPSARISDAPSCRISTRR
jgi:hypothetical protein